MIESKAVKPSTLENLIATIKSDYQRLMIMHNVSWRTPQEKEDARLSLVKSVRDARQAVEGLEGTKDTTLRPLVDQLIIQAEFGSDAVKHPGTLKR